jgi:hypothetical protein
MFQFSGTCSISRHRLFHGTVSHSYTCNGVALEKGRGHDKDTLVERRRLSLGIVPAGVAVTLAIAWTPILPAVIASAEEEVQVGWIAYVWVRSDRAISASS